MNQKGFTSLIAVVVGIAAVGGLMSYLILSDRLPSLFSLPWPSPSFFVAPNPLSHPPSVSVTPLPPSVAVLCKADNDCPSSRYTCEATQSEGIAYPNNSKPSSMIIIKGGCKLKEGNQCNTDTDCIGGLLCHGNTCVSPIGRQCIGSGDTSCSGNYECVQGCGPPVVRQGDHGPTPYFCQLKGYVRACPICLAQNTLIDTPSGKISVQDLQKGMNVWTLNRSGARVASPILETSRTSVPLDHRVIHLVLDDGRELFVSPGHPTADGRTIGSLVVGDVIDKGRVVSVEHIPYQKPFTYDLLPAGDTATYWADDILVGSTLVKR